MTLAGKGNSGLFGKSLFMALCLFFGTIAGFGQSQAAASDLTGTVVDPNGAVVPGATVTARNIGTGITRSTTTDGNGVYNLVAIPPGEYEITAEGTGFKKVAIAPVKLTVGQSAELKIVMQVGAQDAVVTVTGESVELIETNRTAIATTIDQTRIENLPINERSATGFALTISTVGRDNGRPIGPAPTSGLNIGGQRGRSTQVNVDGMDFTDNSINAARSTVSQEAVQEYQVATNSYLPEFGRATGGIINVVTKSGTNDVHGNLFGFLRHSSIQSRNPFAPIIDGDPDKKPPYTRTQYGGTIGFPLVKERMFGFFSFEQRRRQESGFFTTDVVGNLTQSITIPAGVLPVAQTFTGLSAAQVAYVQAMLGPGGIPAFGVAYAHFASAGTQTALNGTSTLRNFLPGLGVPQGSVIGQRFLLSGAPVPLTQVNGQYVAFRPLNQLQKIFPISEATTYSSFRLDHLVAPGHQFNMRISYNPITLNGIQDESQNQVLGQNDYSRTGTQKVEDTSVNVGYTAAVTPTLVNELNVGFGNRWSSFDSRVPSVAQQISGVAFIGSNPFSPVSRTEERWQIRDTVTWVKSAHIFKFGGDVNWISVKAKFELNFPALFNFGQQSAGSFIADRTNPANPIGCDSPILPAAIRCPAFTPTQAYGLGFPSAFIEGFGNPNSLIDNKPLAFFVQDTWKITQNFTLNFGVRYDVELTDEVAPTAFTDPLTGITLTAADVQAAQDAINVQQGFPRDTNNFAPRLGLAWDIRGNGRTLLRAAGGIYYDHPLLAVAFNSDIADGSQQQQATLLPIGGPSPTGLLNAFQVFHGTVCGVQGSVPAICGASVTQAVAPSAHYLFGFQRFDPSTFTGFGPVLPFTLQVSKDFEYPMSFQGNLGIEQMVGKDMVLSANYITQTVHHLAHPTDLNVVNQASLVENFRRFAGRAPTNFAEAAFFSLPQTCAAPAVCPPGWTIVVPGFVGINGLGQKVVSPVAANYFRALGPNYFFVKALTGLNKPQWDALLAGSLRSPGPISPYGAVNAQVSDGNSSYNALNLELKKRFSNNIQFYATYTWSHSIDDSSDLQTLLLPQDVTNFKAERSDSLFDQRHRFVFSGVVSAPESWKGAGGFKSFAYGFMVAPIVEFSSGRPFNILAIGDANGDLTSSNERPTVLSDGTLCQTGVDPGCLQGVFPATGNLGRNRGITHNFFSIDMRVTRKFRFGERWSLDVIGEVFNLTNRFNEASANPFYQNVNAWGERSGNRYYSSPTASFDPRQFQFGLKLNF